MSKYNRTLSLMQGESLEISPLGLRISFKGAMTRGKHLDGVKRSSIKGWSKASVRRLRDELFSYHCLNEIMMGFTGTLPGNIPDEFWQGYAEEFRALIKRFRDRFERRFPHSYLVYRVELQQRGAPHIHAICHISERDLFCELDMEKPDRIPLKCKEDLIILDVRQMWNDSVDLKSLPALGYKDVVWFYKYGARVDRVNRDGMMRYLCDHTSKRKQAQLGWKGRQWGIIGRKNRVPYEVFKVPEGVLGSRVEVLLLRYVRRLQRYRQAAECVFGSRLVGGLRQQGVIFLGKGGISGLRRFLDSVSGDMVNPLM